MKKILLMMSLVLGVLVFTSCSNDEVVNEEVEEDFTERNLLGEMLGVIVETRSPEEGELFISYTPGTGEIQMSNKELASSVENVEDNDGRRKVVMEAPQQRWIYAGYASGKAAAMYLGAKLANSISKDKTVYVKIVPRANGKGWDVYYRCE